MLALAWRNLWRNRRRTGVTLSTVALGAMILILFQGLMDGLLQSAVRNATDLSVGEVQAHAPGYLAELSFYDTLEDPAGIVAAAGARGIGAAPRSYGDGLVARGERSAGARFQGVRPEAERGVFELARHVARGSFLPDAPGKTLVLGRKLARTLGAGVGDEIVVVVQAADGSIGNELFRVGGILKSVNDAVDRGAAMMHEEDFAELFVSGGRVHEIAFHARGTVPLEDLRRTLASVAPGAEVRTWRELLPMLADMTELMGGMLWVFGSIFFVTAGLGVMNTMLMATRERSREIGTLKAIGASPVRIVRDVTVEGFLLALLGTALGLAIGAPLTMAIGAFGIDTARLAGETSFGGVAFDPVWRPALSAGAMARAAIALCVTSVLATLYPAVSAARLDPAAAMRRT